MNGTCVLCWDLVCDYTNNMTKQFDWEICSLRVARRCVGGGGLIAPIVLVAVTLLFVITSKFLNHQS